MVIPYKFQKFNMNKNNNNIMNNNNDIMNYDSNNNIYGNNNNNIINFSSNNYNSYYYNNNCMDKINPNASIIKNNKNERTFGINNLSLSSHSCSRVINLSNLVFPPSVFKVLGKGLNFALASRKIPVEDIICDIEFGIRGLPDRIKDTIRQDCAVALRKARPPKSNLNKEESLALRSLNQNKDIVALKADKGGAAVILNKVDYRSKMLDHLHNSGSYKKLPKNPLKKVAKNVALAIKSIGSISSLHHKLIERNPITPRIYGLPKIHKEGAPLRPIVNTIGGPTYLLAKFLALKLKPLVGHTESFVKDLASFIEELKDIKLEPEDILVSFGVVSLFTCIHINEAMEVINRLTDPDTARLVEICLTSKFFSFEGEFFEQTCGVAMGSPLSPIVANLFMEDFESKALNSSCLFPKLWKRFVDDTNVIWPHGQVELDLFFDHLNNQSSAIKFTKEQEVDGCLPFLDILISKNSDGSLDHQVFRKKTHTEQYLHASSYHFPAQKMGVLNTLAILALRISDKKSFEKEKSHLLDVFVENGYSRFMGERAFRKASKNSLTKREPKERIPGVHLPYVQGVTNKIGRILKKHCILVSFRPLNTIRMSLRSVKDPINPKHMKGVYMIPCSCGTPYIGETGRSINQRISEHAADLKHRRTKSFASTKHAEKTNHHVCIEEASVIAKVSHFHHRKFRETLEIEKRPSNLNREDGWKISRCWVPALPS